MTLSQLVAALDAFAYWEAHSQEHQQNGRNATWEGIASMARKTGANDTPRFFALRILKVDSNGNHHFHSNEVCELNNGWTLSRALPHPTDPPA